MAVGVSATIIYILLLHISFVCAIEFDYLVTFSFSDSNFDTGTCVAAGL